MWQDQGFMQNPIIDTTAAMQQLAELIMHVTERYEKMDADELLANSAPGKWSKQEILGHLIDSAINNLKRFTDAQFFEQPYVVISYRQNELVAVNHYQQLPLHHLLSLWQSLNRQIIFVVQQIPLDILAYKVQPQYDQTGTQTLAWLICDYVEHMKHHLRAMSLLE